MDDNFCGSCGRRDRTLRPVSLWLRVVAFPMIGIMLLRRGGDGNLFDEFCSACRPRQIFCYVIVGIWSMSLVGFLIWEMAHGRNPFAR